MTRVLSRTILTRDEECSPVFRTRMAQLSELVSKCLDDLELDTYNHIYVVRITIDRVDDD